MNIFVLHNGANRVPESDLHWSSFSNLMIMRSIIIESAYFAVPNNRPGQSYLFSTFVPTRMPLLRTGRLLISRNYSRQDCLIGPGHFPKKCFLDYFALLAYSIKKIPLSDFHWVSQIIFISTYPCGRLGLKS